MDLSVVIAYHNEGAEFISASLISLLETIDIYSFEVIIVDDGSEVELSLPQFLDVIILRHDVQRGVGAAFDLGVKAAKSENIFLMGADIRFPKKKWASQMLYQILNNPKSFICTSCVRFGEGNDCTPEIENGATLQLHGDIYRPASYKDVLVTQWLPRIEDRYIPPFEVPCILGAAYGVTKKWYEYVDGFAGHKYWGSLEPYISLKSWLFGGNCLVAPFIFTAHIFNKKHGHNVPREYFVYNKLLIFKVLFKDSEKYIKYIGRNDKVDKAMLLIDGNENFIMNKRKSYLGKVVCEPIDYFSSYGIVCQDY